MANPQAENGFLRIANEIWNEVIRRDFSKRQKDIILFIWRLSYGCKKKSAFIPQLKDFELCGVGPTNVTKELNYLVSCKVIIWDKSTSFFTVAKDYERWQISPVKGWCDVRFKLLIHQNLDKNTYQNDKSSEVNSVSKIIVTYQNNKLRLIKTISLHLSKREVRSGPNPYGCRLERASKDIIKDIIKKRTSTTTPKGRDRSTDFSFANLFRNYEKNFIAGARITQFDVDEFQILFDDYGGEWLLEAMREAYRHDKKNLAYVHGILKGYKLRGGPDAEKLQVSDGVGKSRLPHRSRYEQELDELQRAKEEAKRFEAIGSD